MSELKETDYSVMVFSLLSFINMQKSSKLFVDICGKYCFRLDYVYFGAVGRKMKEPEK